MAAAVCVFLDIPFMHQLPDVCPQWVIPQSISLHDLGSLGLIA